MPVILFLHGSLGNFRGYLWVWKAFADRYGFAVVAPTFGSGDWSLPGGVECVERARQYCARHPQFRKEEIYLAGLSNGGLGVGLAGKQSPAAYRGLIFLSPVMEPEDVGSREFLEGWKGRPVLVLHGMADDRIPLTYIQSTVRVLELSGVNVRSRLWPAEDHFLFFSRRQEVLEEVGEWIAATARR